MTRGRAAVIGRFFRKWFGRRAPVLPVLPGPVAWPPFDAVPTEPTQAVDAMDTVDAADIEDRFYRLVFGFPPSSARAPSFAEQAVLRRVRDAFGGERVDAATLPRVGAILPLVMRSQRSDGPDARAVLAWIQSDPTLAGDILRVANGPRYRRGHDVSTLAEAATAMGPDGMLREVARATVRPLLRSDAGPASRLAGDRLWEHAERCAHACAVLHGADDMALEPFLAGMVGHVAAQTVLAELARRDDMLGLEFSRPFVASLARQVERLSLHAARHWSFPSRVVQALAERADPADAGARTPLGRALLAGSQLAMLDVLAEQGLVGTDAALLATPRQGFGQATLGACRKTLRQRAPAHLLT
ncbi:HDOD domain-containing protein [Luteibacter sp. PPL201]|uniref:HDOD domain-containing protein n=1 Tax=Luteibacter sahnii TaxID=3021977 RepID=A0ABT6BCH1_9GAMM|nr:HDOD domain-containing protein [Luteibacter sp. PPL193]MDY1549261.1 HDOD domain-containing protein [Luteibacter sp. PPL193]